MNKPRLVYILGCCILVCLAALVVSCKILPPWKNELSDVDMAWVKPTKTQVADVSSNSTSLKTDESSGSSDEKQKVPPNIAPSNPFSSGSLEIERGQMADLDQGRAGREAGADIEFEAVTATELYLTPKNGATLAVVGSQPVDYAGCLAAPLAAKRIPASELSKGTHVCLRTDQGRYTLFQITQPVQSGPGVLAIEYTTWK